MELLLANGADVNAKRGDGDKALLLASRKGNEALVKLLIAKGVDFTSKDDEGKTALLLSAEGATRLLYTF